MTSRTAAFTRDTKRAGTCAIHATFGAVLDAVGAARSDAYTRRANAGRAVVGDTAFEPRCTLGRASTTAISVRLLAVHYAVATSCGLASLGRGVTNTRLAVDPSGAAAANFTAVTSAASAIDVRFDTVFHYVRAASDLALTSGANFAGAIVRQRAVLPRDTERTGTTTTAIDVGLVLVLDRVATSRSDALGVGADSTLTIRYSDASFAGIALGAEATATIDVGLTAVLGRVIARRWLTHVGRAHATGAIGCDQTRLAIPTRRAGAAAVGGGFGAVPNVVAALRILTYEVGAYASEAIRSQCALLALCALRATGSATIGVGLGAVLDRVGTGCRYAKVVGAHEADAIRRRLTLRARATTRAGRRLAATIDV